ncbi:WD40-repeat-containing domain protein [Phlyctochytrium arcticum]|nr:WD40-repeat-containing domain protein [Phlyctochytrium arcticum]
MKIKTISRGQDFARERSGDIFKVQRNLDPTLHPFEKAREYTRALNAVKLERLFAKPFVAALSGHVDGVYCIAKHPTKLTTLYSGSADGELKLWSLSTNKCTWSAKGHQGFVRGICSVPNSDKFFSVGEDKTVNLWDPSQTQSVKTYLSNQSFNSADHHRSKNMFATASSKVDIWEHDRADPVQSFSWGSETVTSVRFNQTETSIFASCGTDRTIVIYDLRTSSPLSKIYMAMRTNAIAWNPMEAFNFTTANEDHNCYTYDMRKLDSALNVHKDHVSAVLDLDYSPTGEEFVTGGYDRTVRIFKTREGHSRDIYHTKRMQRIFCVKFSMDAKFVLSGSDDGNIRLWKASASDKLGTTTNRERSALSYTKAVKERYKHMPELRRIDKHRKIPKSIAKAKETKHIMTESVKRKEDNRRKHSKPGAVPYAAERKKNVIAQEK